MVKLLSVHNARAFWQGRFSDINPRGINLFPLVSSLLKETYKFVKYPSMEDIVIAKEAWKFECGEFADTQGSPIRFDLSIYSDGIFVDSASSTDHAESVLKDIFARFDETLNLVKYENVVTQKRYLSELYVTTDKSLELLNPQFKLIAEFLSNNVGEDKHYETGGITFFPDQTSKINTSPFRFERAVEVPFYEKRYYTIAPLQTRKHLELLDKLEKILSKK